MSNLENLRESVIEQAHEKGRMKLLDSKKKIDDEFEMQKSVIVKKKEAEHKILIILNSLFFICLIGNCINLYLTLKIVFYFVAFSIIICRL